MLATHGRPQGALDAWAAEPKLGGWRAIVTATNGKVTVRTRRGKDVTAAVPELALPAQPALRLSARMVAVLRQHRARQAELALAAGSDWSGTMVDDEGVTVSLVFTDEAGRPMPGHRLNDALERIATAAGVGHVNPHRFRHSAASLMIAEGMDLAAVGAVLGHASPAVTMAVYAHAIDRTKAAATDSIAAAVGDW